ncbi:cyclic nucleotide-gated ion channel 1-like [Argentina anserina]|uniref:cyclic nucleotide-gated ion channel 1-like n=1 Tax=Argentina anserina TaxID=57926 RepID=UPI0021766696|nr:cyclic nucleotide-gated ion channel 1-like [Potentilla anserina]
MLLLLFFELQLLALDALFEIEIKSVFEKGWSFCSFKVSRVDDIEIQKNSFDCGILLLRYIIHYDNPLKDELDSINRRVQLALWLLQHPKNQALMKVMKALTDGDEEDVGNKKMKIEEEKPAKPKKGRGRPRQLITVFVKKLNKKKKNKKGHRVPTSTLACLNAHDQLKNEALNLNTSKSFVACNVRQHNLTYSKTVDYNISNWDALCSVNDTEPKIFDFGIYLYALQSDVVSDEEPVSRKMFQSIWWALRNLSSFGSNLNSSMGTLEIFFSASISITGMALFLVFLNARVQGYKERTKRHLLEKKNRLMKPDIDLWLFKNNLSKDMETGGTNKKKKIMETVIIDNIHKLEENSDLNVQNILSVLPKKDKQRIIQCIFDASLKKAPLLQTLDEKVLKAIRQHLVPVTYTEDSYIIQEGKPIGKLLLFTQGSAITFSHGGTGTSSGFSNNKWLKKGDFYGEELLSWFRSPQYLDIPISTENVIAQGKVEAFVIRAGDLRNIFLKFWWLFSKKVDASQLKHWEHLAASSLGILLTTWRRRKAEKGSRALPDSSKACCCFPHHANTKKTLWEKFSVKH